jgi:hypothetical protein
MTTHKLNFRLPMDLFEAAKLEADALHISLNSYVLQALASHVLFTSQQRHRRESKRVPPARRSLRAPRQGSSRK